MTALFYRNDEIPVYLFTENCRNEEDLEKDPLAKELGKVYLSYFTNHQIVLRSSENDNSYKTSDVISCDILNKSGEVVKFSSNYNIKMFGESDSGWSEIFEKPDTGLPREESILDPSSGISSIQTIHIFPDLPDPDRDYQLRIYISGELIKDGESKEVFAYTDLSLHP